VVVRWERQHQLMAASDGPDGETVGNLRRELNERSIDLTLAETVEL